MTFSLGLSEDHVAIRDMIHEFAKRVMRPAAQYYDEHEEFPWPVVQEAAKIGLYDFDFIKSASEDPTNQTFPIAMEELFWGDAGCGMAIMGSSLASAGIRANGTDEQANEWVPQCYGDANDVKLGAFCATEAEAGSDVSSLRTRAEYKPATDEWVLNGTKVFITNGGIANVHVVVAAVEVAGDHHAHRVEPRVAGAPVARFGSLHGAAHILPHGHVLVTGTERLLNLTSPIGITRPLYRLHIEEV